MAKKTTDKPSTHRDASDTSADSAPGQQQTHGVINAATGESRQVTQAQWRKRRSDATLEGFTRVDDSLTDD